MSVDAYICTPSELLIEQDLAKIGASYLCEDLYCVYNCVLLVACMSVMCTTLVFSCFTHRQRVVRRHTAPSHKEEGTGIVVYIEFCPHSCALIRYIAGQLSNTYKYAN